MAFEPAISPIGSKKIFLRGKWKMKETEQPEPSEVLRVARKVGLGSY